MRMSRLQVYWLFKQRALRFPPPLSCMLANQKKRVGLGAASTNDVSLGGEKPVWKQQSSKSPQKNSLVPLTPIKSIVKSISLALNYINMCM